MEFNTGLFKMDTKNDLLYSTGNSAQCYVAAWMEGEFGEELNTCVCMAVSLAVHLKLS